MRVAVEHTRASWAVMFTHECTDPSRRQLHTPMPAPAAQAGLQRQASAGRAPAPAAQAGLQRQASGRDSFAVHTVHATMEG